MKKEETKQDSFFFATIYRNHKILFWIILFFCTIISFSSFFLMASYGLSIYPWDFPYSNIIKKLSTIKTFLPQPFLEKIYLFSTIIFLFMGTCYLSIPPQNNLGKEDSTMSSVAK